MTPRELAAAIRARRRPAPQPIGRDAFDRLMVRFPDGDGEDDG